MGENRLIISLGTMAIGEEITLEKLVDNGAEKNFGKILDYMLDPREDSLNPAYNSEERELRDRILGWKERAEKDAGSFDLMYLRTNGNYSEPLSLDGYISDFNDIIKQKTRRTEFGEELNYEGVDLVAKFEPVGGQKVHR